MHLARTLIPEYSGVRLTKEVCYTAECCSSLMNMGEGAQSITELRIGMVGGESAQDRMNDFSCLQEYAEDALGVPVKMFAPADIGGVVQGHSIKCISMVALM